jgi:hypothetical protein
LLGLLPLLLLARGFIGFMVANGAACGSSQHAVVAREVSCNSSDRCPFQTTFGLGCRRTNKQTCGCSRDDRNLCLHFCLLSWC